MAQDERAEKCLMPMNRNLSLLDANTKPARGLVPGIVLISLCRYQV